MSFALPVGEISAQLRHNRLCSHNVNAIDAGEIHSADSLQFGVQIELRHIAIWAGPLTLLLNRRGNFSLRFCSFYLALWQVSQQYLQPLVTLGNLVLIKIVGTNGLFELE